MVKVSDIMNSNIISVHPCIPVIEVAHQMKVLGTWVIPVCDHRRFQGLITESDIVTKIVATATDPVTEPASSVMNKHQPVISPGEDITQAARVMVNNDVWVLPVVQDGELLGLLTLDGLAEESLALAALVFSKTIRPRTSTAMKVPGKRTGNDYTTAKLQSKKRLVAYEH